MRSRFSFPLAWMLALLGLVLAAIVVVVGLGGSESKTATTPKGGPLPSANVIDWKLFGRVPERIHYLRSDIDPPLEQIWEYNDQALIEFPPAIADGRLFVVNKYSNVRALDAATGRIGRARDLAH